ncbi:MAG TPA: rhombosortase [Opitutaceae bacterium]|nr:rhombosortase [Opitutaceae bacterium]
MPSFASRRLPWTFLLLAVIALAIEINFSAHGSWRELLLYDRSAVARGEWWRLWTGHLVHFGWPHFVADTGLFVILGFLLENRHPVLSRVALVFLPLVISGSLFLFDPAMARYGGLSAVDLGLLVFLACAGWQRNWVDWFWPAVLAIYVGEIIFEATYGRGHGGGMIRFDDPAVRVATAAHIPGAIFGCLLSFATRRKEPKRSRPASADGKTG